jgi:hypothetical protein
MFSPSLSVTLVYDDGTRVPEPTNFYKRLFNRAAAEVDLLAGTKAPTNAPKVIKVEATALKNEDGEYGFKVFDVVNDALRLCKRYARLLSQPSLPFSLIYGNISVPVKSSDDARTVLNRYSDLSTKHIDDIIEQQQRPSPKRLPPNHLGRLMKLTRGKGRHRIATKQSNFD